MNDPIADFYLREDEQAEYVSKCPVCSICGEPILDEYYYQIGDIVFHLECAERKSVDSYVNGY